MARTLSTIYMSVACSKREKARVDAAAKKAGLNRNRFIRRWIASLPDVDDEPQSA